MLASSQVCLHTKHSVNPHGHAKTKGPCLHCADGTPKRCKLQACRIPFATSLADLLLEVSGSCQPKVLVGLFCTNECDEQVCFWVVCMLILKLLGIA